jgi:hypothetical protein
LLAHVGVVTLESLARGDTTNHAPDTVLLVDKSGMERHAAQIPEILRAWFLDARAPGVP